jgi:choline-sulfatase
MKFFRALSIVPVALLMLSCPGKKETAKSWPAAPVILISIDTLRADHLPAYGYQGVKTPAIDALAADGTVFEQAWSHCPMTLPSHLSMLTGLLPTEHGVRNNLGFRFDATKHPSLPQRLKAKGYATGAAVSSYVLRGETGMRSMFDNYDDAIDPRPGAEFSDYQRAGDVTAQRGASWIGQHAASPFFFFLHLYEPHVPYAPQEPFRATYAASPYDGEIATADAILGRFIDDLKQRGIYDRALIILTSDHGEGLGDHGEQQHSILLYDEAIHVPLIVKLPGGERRGTRASQPVALVDIAPTVARITGMEPLATPHAYDLFGEPQKERSIYAETIYPWVQLGWSDLRSLVTSRFHFIDGPRPELYDLGADPKEARNVIDEQRRIAASMKQQLAAFPAADAISSSVDPEVASKLASLGYIGAARTRPSPRSLPNPRDVIGVLDEMQRGFALASDGKLAEARTTLQTIVRQQPRLVDVWIRLAEVETAAGDLDAAIRDYRTAIEAAGVISSDVIASLADVQLQAGKIADAEASARLALRESPDKAGPVLVRAALARRDAATAERLVREQLEGNTTPSLLVLQGEVLKARGDLNGAMASVASAEQRATETKQGAVFGANALRGEVFAISERPADAIAAYEREIASFPGNRTAYARLAVVYFLTGDRAAVDRTMKRMVTANPGANELAARTYDAFGESKKAATYR